MSKPLLVILTGCLIHLTLFAGQSLEIPNIEAAQRALQERYMRFYEIAEGLGYDLGDAPPHLSFPRRSFDGRDPGLFPEDCFYEPDIFDEHTGRAETEVIYNLIGNLINQPLPDWDYWVHPSWHGAIEGRDATNGRMGVLGPIPYPGNVMTPENYLDFFRLFTARLNEMSVLQFQVNTTDLSGDPQGAPITRNVGIGTEGSCPMAKQEALSDFLSNAPFPLEQPGTIFNLERTQGTHFRYVELVGGVEERHTAYIHGTEGRFVIDYSGFPGTAVVYGRLYDAALINLGFPSTVDLEAGDAPHDEYNRWFRLDSFSGSDPGPYLSVPFAEHAQEAFVVPCPSGEFPANGEYFGWGIAARVVVTPEYDHFPSNALVTCGEACLGCQGVAGLCSELKFGSFDFRMGLGKGSEGDAGFLQLYNDTIDPLSASPFGLNLHLAGEGATVLRDGDYDNVLRQVVSDQVLVDVEIVEPYRRYVVRHYVRDDDGVVVDGFYRPDPADAFKEVTVENPQEPQFQAAATTDLAASSFFFFAPNHGIPSGMLFQGFVDGTAGALPEFWVNGPLRRDELYVLYAFDAHHLTVMWWDAANGWWDFDQMVEADPSQTLHIQTPQPFGTLTVTERRGGRERIMEYAASTASPATNGTFELFDVMENKQRRHTRTRVFDADGASFIDTLVKTDGEGNLIEEVERHYRVFPWNHLSFPARQDRAELVREVRDPHGNPRVTRFEYYDDPVADGQNYGRLKSEEHPDGFWAAYDYDAEGRTGRVYRPFLDSELSLTPAGNRMEEIVRQEVADLEGTGVEGRVITTIESIDGDEVSRRYRLVWSEPVDGLFRVATIDAVYEGATWQASENRRTDRWRFADGKHQGELARIKHPDGTMSFYDYATNTETGEKTRTVRRGVPNGNESDVIDGTETITVINVKGGRVSRVVYDIETGIVLESAITMPEDFDELGRPLVVLFHDGTFETREYEDCCGTVTVTDRSGLTRVERTEMDGSVMAVESNGITIRYEEGYRSNDVPGFTRSTIREGRGDAGTVVTQVETFDPAGRRIAALDPRDGIDRLTLFEQSLNALGQEVRTTTLADGAVSVDVVHRDGFPRLHQLNGLDTVRYEYGVESDTHEIFDGNAFVSHSFMATAVREIRVGPDGEESEWEKRYLDMLGRVYKVEIPDAEGNAVGHYSRTIYDTRGFPRKEIDPDGVTTLYGYNDRGELEFTVLDLDGRDEIDPSGTQRITRFTQEVVDDPERGEMVRRTVSVWETDHQDTETVVALAESSTDGLHVWESVYDQPPTHIETVYEGGGRIVRRVASPDGSVGTVTEVNGFLESETVIHPAEETLLDLTHTPDGFDRRSSTTDSLRGTTTTYEYYDSNLLRSVTTPESQPGAGDDRTTEFVYDVMGRLTTTKLPNQATTERRYHDDGALRMVFGQGTNPVEYTYDRQGRLRSMTTWRAFDYEAEEGVPGEGATTVWNYNARGYLESKADPVGEKVRYTYTAGGRIRTRDWARLGADGINPVRTVYGYGPGGIEDDSVIDGNLRGVFYQNDSSGTPEVHYTYYRSGRVATIDDGSGFREFDYKSGLLQREHYLTGGMNSLAGISINREFDLRRLHGLEVEGPAGSLYRADYSYENQPYLRSAEFLGHRVVYTNNPGASERQVLTYHNGESNVLSVVRHFDNLDRLTKQESTIAGGPVRSYRYRYTNLDQRDRMTAEDGSFWEYGYDELGQVVSGVRKRPDANPLPGYDYAYTFDQIGNRLETKVNDRPASYTPNLLNQYENREVPRALDVLGLAHPDAAVTVDGHHATRDGELFYHALDLSAGPESENPQWLGFSVTGTLSGGGHNDSDRVAEESRSAYLPANPETFQHDADGNLLRDGRWTYAWDAENRLIRMESTPEAVTAGARHLRLEFAYDSQHRRIRKTVEEFGGEWSVIDDRLLVYDGWNLLAELDATASTVERSYLWGLDLSDTFQGAGGVGGLLMNAAGDEIHFPIYDGNGNTMALVDAATGTETAQYEYGPFGEPIRATGPAAETNPFRFSTKYTDPETHLLYYGFRYLNPSTARWLNRDPIEESGGLNLYALVGNNGVDAWDYLGLSSRCLEECYEEAFGDYLLDAARLEDIGESRIESFFGSARYDRRSALADLGVNVSRTVRDTAFTVVGSYAAGSLAATRSASVARSARGLYSSATSLASVNRAASVASSAQRQANYTQLAVGTTFGVGVSAVRAESLGGFSRAIGTTTLDKLGGNKFGQFGLAVSITQDAYDYMQKLGFSDDEIAGVLDHILGSIENTHESLLDRLEEALVICEQRYQ